jgi:hypothetical protein
MGCAQRTRVPTQCRYRSDIGDPLARKPRFPEVGRPVRPTLTLPIISVDSDLDSGNRQYLVRVYADQGEMTKGIAGSTPM